MIKLTIFNADGSIYWVEHLNDAQAAQAWLNEEQTRPYWKAEYTHSIVDETASAPAPTTEQLMGQLRAKRSGLLAACDWTQLPDTPLESAVKIQWETYRQALRDLPEKTTDPANPAWPVAPGAAP